MRKFLSICIAAAVFVISSSVFASGAVKWTKVFGGAGDDEGTAVQQTKDGGYIMAGYTNSFGAGGYDIYLVKMDSSGDTIWTGTYGGTKDDEAYSVQQTKDGGYMAAGYTESAPSGGIAAYLIKTSPYGDTLWTMAYAEAGNEQAWDAHQTLDSGYIITGYINRTNTAGGNDILLIKTDANGDTIWTRTYGTTTDDWGTSVRQTSDSGYIIAGNTKFYSSNDYKKMLLIKTDSKGDTMWTHTYGGNADNWACSALQTKDGGYLLEGWTTSFGAGSYDVYLVKTKSNGDTLWTRTYGGSGDDEGYSACQTTDSGYIITGETNSYGAGGYDVYLIKTNAGGDTVWTRTYGGTSDDWGNAVQQTKDGGYIITGVITRAGTGTDVYLLKTDSLGVGVEENPKIKLQSLKFYIVQNPARGFASISYYIPAQANVSLKVYDITGNLVRTLVSGTKGAGSYNAELGGLTEGVYFARLAVGNEIITRKMVLLK